MMQHFMEIFGNIENTIKFLKIRLKDRMIKNASKLRFLLSTKSGL